MSRACDRERRRGTRAVGRVLVTKQPATDVAYRPGDPAGGIVAIREPVRQEAGGTIHQVGSLLDLFFSIFSEAGTWSTGEVAGWIRDAGLEARVPRSSWMMPDLALHIGFRHG